MPVPQDIYWDNSSGQQGGGGDEKGINYFELLQRKAGRDETMGGNPAQASRGVETADVH